MPDRRYSAPARIFHWLIAGMILFQVPLAYYMIDLPLGPEKLERYALHKSIGLTIFALSAVERGIGTDDSSTVRTV